MTLRVFMLSTFLLTVQHQTLSAQNVSKRVLKNSHWVANNRDSLFYNSDTLELYSILNLKKKCTEVHVWDHRTSIDSSGYFVNLTLNGDQTFDFTSTKHWSGGTYTVANFLWNFDKKQQELTLFIGDVKFDKFRIIHFEKIQIGKNYPASHPKVIAKKLTVKRLKN